MIGGREVTQIEGAMAKVIVERRGAVLEIRLNRPELLNAVDREAIAALGAAIASRSTAFRQFRSVEPEFQHRAPALDEWLRHVSRSA